MTRLLRLGAFDVAVEGCSPFHCALLEGLFRTRLESLRMGAAVNLRMTLGAAGARFSQTVALECREENGRTYFSSDVVAGHLDRASIPFRLSLGIDDGNEHVRHLDLYLRIVLNAVLRRLDRLRLHAAAVELPSGASLFVGEKGAGKTTICLHLARAGGTVLGEDQIMVRRTAPDAYVVAGGDGRMRLTVKTEEHFFPEPLPEPALIVAGVSKKEIDAGQHVHCEPNLERPPRRLVFPELGQSFAIRTLSGREAVGRLAAPLLPIHRFTGNEDRRDFIAFLAGLTRQTECFALTLTPDLADLERLSEFLA